MTTITAIDGISVVQGIDHLSFQKREHDSLGELSDTSSEIDSNPETPLPYRWDSFLEPWICSTIENTTEEARAPSVKDVNDSGLVKLLNASQKKPSNYQKKMSRFPFLSGATSTAPSEKRILLKERTHSLLSKTTMELIEQDSSEGSLSDEEEIEFFTDWGNEFIQSVRSPRSNDSFDENPKRGLEEPFKMLLDEKPHEEDEDEDEDGYEGQYEFDELKEKLLKDFPTSCYDQERDVPLDTVLSGKQENYKEDSNRGEHVEGEWRVVNESEAHVPVVIDIEKLAMIHALGNTSSGEKEKENMTSTKREEGSGESRLSFLMKSGMRRGDMIARGHEECVDEKGEEDAASLCSGNLTHQLDDDDDDSNTSTLSCSSSSYEEESDDNDSLGSGTWEDETDVGELSDNGVSFVHEISTDNPEDGPDASLINGSKSEDGTFLTPIAELFGTIYTEVSSGYTKRPTPRAAPPAFSFSYSLEDDEPKLPRRVDILDIIADEFGASPSSDDEEGEEDESVDDASILVEMITKLGT